jgi:hypothetical protein
VTPSPPTHAHRPEQPLHPRPAALPRRHCPRPTRRNRGGVCRTLRRRGRRLGRVPPARPGGADARRANRRRELRRHRLSQPGDGNQRPSPGRPTAEFVCHDEPIHARHVARAHPPAATAGGPRTGHASHRADPTAAPAGRPNPPQHPMHRDALAYQVEASQLQKNALGRSLRRTVALTDRTPPCPCPPNPC